MLWYAVETCGYVIRLFCSMAEVYPLFRIIFHVGLLHLAMRVTTYTFLPFTVVEPYAPSPHSYSSSL